MTEIIITDEPSQTAGFISWTRLVHILREAGELSPDEKIVRVETSSVGFSYYLSEKST
jgi:hypothetical protein